MVTLVSPGVSVSVIDESFYVSSGPGTVPLVILATQQDKLDPSGSSVAEGTEKENAGKLYLITSQRELLQTFGDPYFASVGGTSKHGYSLNEYGLLAAHSYLGLANRAYVIRADVDLAELEPLDNPPVGEPAAGTYWLDMSNTTIGLFVWNETDGVFEAQEVSVLLDETLIDSAGVPLPSAPGEVGSFTVVGGVVAGSGAGREENQVFRRDALEWVLLDAPAISENVIYRSHVQVPQAGELLDMAIDSGGTGYAVNDTIDLIDGGVGTGAQIRVDTVATDVDAVSVNNPGVGYSVADVLVNASGTGTQATFTVNDVSTIVGQTEADFAASFTAGSGHAPADVITMDDGSTITVVTETAGVIDTFTVTTNSTSGLTENATISQASTTGTGVGFDMTLADANQEIYSLTLTTPGSYTVSPDLVDSPTTGGTGTGATVDLTVNAAGPVSTFTIVSKGTGYDGSGLTQDATSGSGLGFTATANVLTDGDYWVKTTSPDGGCDFVVNLFDGDASQFIEVEAPLARTRNDALLLYQNDPQVGDLFTQYDMNNESKDSLNFGENSRVEFSLMRHNGQGHTIAMGSVQIPTVTDGNALIINGVTVTFTNANTGNDLPLNDTLTDTGVIGLINSASIPYVTASASDDNELVLTHSQGKDIEVIDAIGTPIAELGLVTEISVTNGYVHSNWSYLVYEANTVEPVAVTPDGTLWHSTSLQVDFLVNNGQGQWDEFTGDVFMQPDEPTVSPSINDLWIDTDQVDDYPVISRWNGTSWVELDNTDQTTSNGVLFRDARPTPTFGDDLGINNGEEPFLAGFPDLDADAPSPLLYPGGMLLWNTRYSTNNVKKWIVDYTFEGTLIGNRWVTESGNRADGSPYMGQDAVKQVIIESMAAALAANEDIRAESIFYNLIVAPGFPEMIDEMVTLNTDRLLTSFVIGDTPFTLGSTGTELQNWATNFNGAVSNGDDGLLTSDTYVGMYYPSGLTTNVDGQEVVVPPSHIALRTMGFNDQVAYQWFAPAGYQRGVVTNAVNVGFVNEEDEFVPVELNQGQRDVLYTNNINPIAFRPNKGLVVFGQKTRHPISSALDRINVVRLINYIRYQSPQLAEPFLFQPNDEITRAQVVTAFNRMLNELVVLRGLYDFLVVCDDSNNTDARIDRNELWIDILIQPVKAIEFIYIPVRVRNTGSDLSLAS